MIYRYKLLGNIVDREIYEFTCINNTITLCRIFGDDDFRLYIENIYYYIIDNDIIIAHGKGSFHIARSIDIEVDNRYKKYFTYSKIFKISIIE